MNVYILATCRNPELLRATTMVFDTLRVGFPTANIYTRLNFTPNGDISHQIAATAEKSGVVFRTEDTIHHDWISGLIRDESEPFFILDTDVVFWKSVEGWKFDDDVAIAGRFIPSFFDRFTNCITMARLHTALLYINPVLVRRKVDEYFKQFPDTPFNPKPNPVNPTFVPLRIGILSRSYFYDTCSMLYHSIGGLPFTFDQLDCYDHLGFGTISDIVCPHYRDKAWREMHFAAFADPSLLKGSWKTDDLFYASQRV